ncbi:response regulator transcription factor [Candidatus Cyanaurora vandensis]|uniref:response regulator n=1 Tax=Candidatus Cyanaurora vandensis TaxID=2714958 RepID=UPI00257D230B|nr:response regulator transcription factor [Candidatus Cyanaurora vandensis]
MRIVLVEDHTLTRIGLKLTLRQEGFNVVGEAANGRQGLVAIERYRPDLAIIDIGLPDIDGVEVTRLSKAKFPHIPVVILTLQDMDETVKAAFAAGADSYCLKDIAGAMLAQVLRLTAAGTRWVDPACG